MVVHQSLAGAPIVATMCIRAIQADARAIGAANISAARAAAARAAHAERLTGPAVAAARRWRDARSHRFPAPRCDSAGELACSRRGCGYALETLFDDRSSWRSLRPSHRTAIDAWARIRTRTAAYCSSRSTFPTLETDAVEVPTPATVACESTRQLGACCATCSAATPLQNFRLFCPDETNSNRLSNVFETENRCPVGRHLRSTITSRRTAASWSAERASLRRLAGGVRSPDATAFVMHESSAMVSASMTVQHAVALEATHLPWRRRWRRSTSCSLNAPGTITTASATRDPG